jgi:hypothetical protein
MERRQRTSDRPTATRANMVKDTSAGRIAADRDDATPATRCSKTWGPEADIAAGQAKGEARYCLSSRTRHTVVLERYE